MLKSILKKTRRLISIKEPYDNGIQYRDRADRPRDPIELAFLYGMLR